MRHDGKTEPYARSHVVAKHNKRLVIRCVETGNIAYTPPDFLRHKIRNRDSLSVLAERMSTEWPNPIQAIMDFESSF